MSIHESGENYLEAILTIRNRTGSCRSIDIARELNFSKPSVSVMMRELHKQGFIKIDSSKDISLTKKGLEIAAEISERHDVISKVLMRIGVPSEIAYKDACKIEHDLNPITFEKIKEYYLSHKE